MEMILTVKPSTDAVVVALVPFILTPLFFQIDMQLMRLKLAYLQDTKYGH